MLRKVIKIDEDKCVGCGLCANACSQGAIGIVDGKAKLLNPNHCDGLGNCIPECPTDAISFEDREIEDANEEAPIGCPGMQMKSLKGADQTKAQDSNEEQDSAKQNQTNAQMESELMQWPVQINLVPVSAPYFKNADLLIAADCTAYAYAGFHNDFMKDRVTIIGCPKLDPVDYSEKLTEIIKNNDINSVTVARMEVPCCGGIQAAVETAIANSGKLLPSQVITISTDGKIIK